MTELSASRSGVGAGTPPVDNDHRLVTHNPGIVPLRQRGDVAARYLTLARVLAAAAEPVPYAGIAHDVAALHRVAVLEAWWLTAQLTRHYDSLELRELAGQRRAWAADRAREASVTSSLVAAPTLERQQAAGVAIR